VQRANAEMNWLKDKDAPAPVEESEAAEPVYLNILHVCHTDPQLYISVIGVDLFVNTINDKGGVKFGSKGTTYLFAVDHHIIDGNNPPSDAEIEAAFKPPIESGKYDIVFNCHPSWSHELSWLTEPRGILVGNVPSVE
jgi:hypothetical protein